MAVSVEIDAATGGATLRVTGLEAGQALQLSLQDMRTRQYLGPSGWAKNRKILARVDASPENTASIPLPAGLAALIAPGTACLLEDIRIALRLQFTWPVAPVAEPAYAPEPEPEPAPAPETPAAATQNAAQEAKPADEVDASPIVGSPPTTPRSRAVLLLAAGIVLGATLSAGASWLWPSTVTAFRLPVMMSSHQNVTTIPVDGPDKARLRDHEAVIQRQKTVIEKLQGDLSAAILLRDRASLDAKTPTNTEEVSALEAQVKALSAKLADSNRMLADYRTQVDGLNASLSRARSEHRNDTPLAVGKEVAQLEDQIKLYRKELDDQTRNYRALWDEKNDLLQKIQALEYASSRTDEIAKANWGAAAMSSGGSIATILNQTDRDAAENIALVLCRGKGGKDCVIREAWQDGCFALARPRGPISDDFGMSVRKDWRVAETKALEACSQRSGDSNCKVAFTVCTPHNLSKPTE